MPYKDPAVKRQKAREYAERARAKKAQQSASPQPEPTISTASSSPSGESYTPPPPPSYKPRSQGKRRPTGEVSEAAVRSLHGVVDRAVVLCNIMLIDEPDRMTEDEREAIFLPLERIYLRHASAPEVSPDMADAGVSAAALFAYLMRIGAFNGLISRTRGRAPRSRNTRPGPGAQTVPNYGGNGSGMGGSASGPAQGGNSGARTASGQDTGPLTPEQVLERLHAETYVPEPDAA